MPIHESLLQRLQLCTSLPTPPSTAVKLIDLVNDPNTSLIQIADCVAFDPALAVKMLKVANSPLYSTRRTATNVRQAVNLMGTHAAVTVALSFSLVRTLSGTHKNDEELLFWKRSILSALACRILAGRFGFNPDDLLVAGLLQNIGVLALQTTMPDEYPVDAMALDDEALLEAEKAKFGSGHDEVGYWLLKKWRLPDHLALACIASHVAPSTGETPPSPGGCVAVSGYFADVFIKGKDTGAVQKVTNAASRWLGMDADSTATVLEKMGGSAKEFEDLFDVPLIAVEQAEAIVDQAKELVMIASLGKLRELEEKAQRDALTGAHNRQYFDEAFNQEFAASSRHGWPLSVAFIDIDHFKQVNDTYGHAAGDNALVTLSRLISTQIRNGDIFARYGGEEFVLLLPGMDSDAAWIVLSRIREVIASFAHTFGDATFNMTISAGLASHKDGTLTYVLPEELLHAADNALYAAKHMGRNQIVRATKEIRMVKHSLPLRGE